MEKWKLPSQSQDPLFQRTYLKPLSVQARCPGCNKLYRIDTRDMKSSQPHFDCVSCPTTFTLEPDEKNPRVLRTRALGNVKYSSASQLQFAPSAEGLKKCPKCETFNPRLASECRKCGVIFAKLEDLPLDAKTGALPSLVKAWQDLMEDYSNVTKHMAFVDRCDDLQAVPFALKKYQDLKEAQPHDKIAQEMLHHVLLKAFARKAEVVTENPSVRLLRDQVNEWIDQVNWSRVARLSPLALSGLLILVGASNAGLRNLIGIGVSILFITLGLALITKGRIHWSDFWD
jgi:hypothetical protein